MNDMDILELARYNQQTAWKILEHTGIIPAWEHIGAIVHLVGSLKSGLLAKSRDIDLRHLRRRERKYMEVRHDSYSQRLKI